MKKNNKTFHKQIYLILFKINHFFIITRNNVPNKVILVRFFLMF
jgi:hypothetical protein